MNKAIVCRAAIILVLWGLHYECFGRVGDSKEQLFKRFGEPVLQTSDKYKIPGANEMGFDHQFSFLHDGVLVKVNMRSGKSVAEQFIFLRGNSVVPITNGMLGKVEGMLKSSTGGQEWARMPAAVTPDDFLFFWSPSEKGSVAYVRRDIPSVLVVEGSDD